MMRAVRTSLALALLLSLSSGAALAQATAPATATAPAKPVLSYIPADALGYVLVNDITRTTSDIDAFLEDVHAKQLMGGASAPGMLDMLRGAAMLGHGFNPAGAFAVVMLDPKAYGYDLLGAVGAEDPETLPSEQQKPPFVLIVPGSGVNEVFGAYQITDSGKYKTVQLRMGEMLAGAKDGYVFLSPVERVLDTIMGAAPQSNAQMAMNKTAAGLLEKSDLVVHINAKVAGPLYIQWMEQMQQKQAQMMGDDAAMMQSWMALSLGYYREILPQIEAMTFVVRFAKTGIVVDEVLAAVPGSDVAKAMAAVEAKTPKALLADVPNLNYVIAFGGATASAPQMTDLVVKIIDQAFKTPQLAAISPETQAKAKSVITGLSEQVQGNTGVFGQVTSGTGQMAAAWVIQSKDSAKTTALLADAASVTQELITTLAAEEESPELAQLKISYNKNVVSEGGLQADAITLSHPDLAEDEDAKQNITTLLGEDQIRILVSTVDAKTVAMTIGGAIPTLQQTVETAKADSGPIGTLPELKEPLGFMPDKLQFIFVMNMKNGFDMIKNIAKAMGEDSEPPFSITANTPITVGVTAIDNGAHEVIYIPNSLIRNGVDIYVQMTSMMMGGGPGGPGGQQAPPADDF